MCRFLSSRFTLFSLALIFHSAVLYSRLGRTVIARNRLLLYTPAFDRQRGGVRVARSKLLQQNSKDQPCIMRMLTEPVLRALTRIAAVVCIGLGLVGLFLPVLPTTPFLILATVLSFRSSPRLRYWLLKHPVFGSTIRNFLRNRAISATALKSALAGLWLGLIVSVLLIQKIWVTVSLGIIGLGVTVYLLRLNRLDPPE